MKHSTARNVIERCFGMLKLWWVILRSPFFYPIRTHNHVILACCLLHNLIRHEDAIDPLEAEMDVIEASTQFGEDNVISTIEPNDAWSNWRDNLALQMFNEFSG